MATKAFFRMGLVCAIAAFCLMFIAFASPYWYKSWTRVHSSFGNIGLWHICLSGYTMPKDPVMKSYVGCWWIHSTEFELVANDIMPPWFRIIQMLCVFTLILDLVGMILLLVYLLEGLRKRFFKNNIGRVFIIDSILLLVSAFFVFLISLIFAEMSRDSSWMPRPWMNYLSWSFGLCVVSGFFAAFGGILIFILGLIFLDKDKREVDNLDSAAELRRREMSRRGDGKEEEVMAMKPSVPSTHIAPTRFSPPEEEFEKQPPPVAAKPPPPQRVGESFV